MAITLTNEITTTYKNVNSSLISPFMRPVVYFNVPWATPGVNPSAEIDLSADGKTITFDCIYKNNNLGYNYYYCDLSDVLKYVLRYFDRSWNERKDDLPFVNGNVLSKVVNYMREVTMTIYFDRGGPDEETLTQNLYLAYFANDIPSPLGFNLGNFNVLENLADLKWCRDTYNAIFFVSSGATTITVNGQIVFDDVVDGYGIYQWKFGKDYNVLQNGINEVKIKTPMVDEPRVIHIEYDKQTRCRKCLAWQHPKLGYVSYPFEGSSNTRVTGSDMGKVNRQNLTMINASSFTENIGKEGKKTVTLFAKVQKKYWKLFEYLYTSRHVYLYTGNQFDNWIGREIDTDNLESNLKQLYIQNKEIDNTIVGTLFKIQAHNTAAKTITLNHPVPAGVTVPDDEDRYWAMYVGPGNACNISAISADRLTITYTRLRNAMNVGSTVYFMNPFINGRMIGGYDWLLGPQSGWGAKYVAPNGVFQKKDGTYKMLCGGVNASDVHSIGVATSYDLITWSYDDGNPIFECGVAPFDKTWCASNLLCSANPVNKTGTKIYYMLCEGKDSNGLRHTGCAEIDEDLNVIKIFNDPIAIPGQANIYGYSGGSIAFWRGKYYVSLVRRTRTNYDDWIAYFMEMNMDTLTAVSCAQMFTSSGLNNWNGRNIDQTYLFVYNDILYCFVGGTGESSAGPLYGNRSYGLLRYNGVTWQQAANNPVIINPIEGYYLWPSVKTWCIDHAGGSVCPIIRNNKIYLFFSMNYASNSYYVTGFVFDLHYLDDNMTTWIECEVSGVYEDNDTKNAKMFSVDLEVPGYINIKM